MNRYYLLENSREIYFNPTYLHEELLIVKDVVMEVSKSHNNRLQIHGHYFDECPWHVEEKLSRPYESLQLLKGVKYALFNRLEDETFSSFANYLEQNRFQDYKINVVDLHKDKVGTIIDRKKLGREWL